MKLHLIDASMEIEHEPLENTAGNRLRLPSVVVKCELRMIVSGNTKEAIEKQSCILTTIAKLMKEIEVQVQ